MEMEHGMNLLRENDCNSIDNPQLLNHNPHSANANR
jgi:hypothetical protein